MGGALAGRLQHTHPLLVHDRSPAAVRSLTEQGATACAALGELASECDVILLCLPTSDHVRTVLFDDGIAENAKPGTIIVDQTSGDPNATKVMAHAGWPNASTAITTLKDVVENR